MNIETCIKERRSVRKYAETEISDETFKEIIDLARYAPSWKNTQPTRYHVVRSAEVREAIANNCLFNSEFNAKTINRCKALVIVTVIKNASGFEADGNFSTPQGDRWEMFDAGIATQTFCLAAHAKGVANVIIGSFDNNKIGNYYKVPENEKVIAMIATGYPAADPKPAPPRKNVEDLISFL